MAHKDADAANSAYAIEQFWAKYEADVDAIANMPAVAQSFDAGARTLAQAVEKALNRNYAMGRTEGRTEAVKALAGAMRKILPAELMRQVLDHLDPLTPFVEALRRSDD